MRTICLVILICMLPALNGMAQDSFGPWGADVAVGDEAVYGPGASGASGISVMGHDDCCASFSGAQGTDRGVYDAFTGGAVLLIRVFQIWISPLDGPSCRFRPTCSAYGKTAVQKYGAFFGGVLAGDRILRCNIFSKPGSDPVPDIVFGK